jgi:hypothetical protein
MIVLGKPVTGSYAENGMVRIDGDGDLGFDLVKEGNRELKLRVRGISNQEHS